MPHLPRVRRAVPAAVAVAAVALISTVGRPPASADGPKGPAAPPTGERKGVPKEEGCEAEVPCRAKINPDAVRAGREQRLEVNLRAVAAGQRYRVANGTVGAGGFKTFAELPVPQPGGKANAAQPTAAGGNGAGENRPAGGGRGAAKGEPAGDVLADLSAYVKDGAAAVALGKALYWDMAVGSDGVTACATCHFHAGTDGRTRHSFSAHFARDFRGPNQLPLNLGQVTSRSEVFGSAGVERRIFAGFGKGPVAPGGEAAAGGRGPGERYEDTSIRLDPQPLDPVAWAAAWDYLETLRREHPAEYAFVEMFKLGGRRVRLVTARNSPTVHGSGFFDRQFHDGRAANEFNGYGLFGDASAPPGFLVTAYRVRSRPGPGGEAADEGTRLERHVPAAAVRDPAAPGGSVLADLEWRATDRMVDLGGRRVPVLDVPDLVLPAGYVVTDVSLDGRGVWWKPAGRAAVRVPVRIPNASLASQATGPVVSEVEMSWDGRQLFHIGFKLLTIVRTPLKGQAVHPEDSVFGGPNAGRYLAAGGKGLKTDYAAMIRDAFHPAWVGDDAVLFRDRYSDEYFGAPPGPAPDARGYRAAEANFALFFGLSVMLYEATLVPDDSRFDRYARGLGRTGAEPGLSAAELRGLDLFRRTGCVDCHGTPEFSSATLSHLRGELREAEDTLAVTTTAGLVERMAMRPDPRLEADVARFVREVRERYGARRAADVAVTLEVNRFYDAGFYNLGVRPTREDRGVGGTQDDDPGGAELDAPAALQAPPFQLNRRYRPDAVRVSPVRAPADAAKRQAAPPPGPVGPPGQKRVPRADAPARRQAEAVLRDTAERYAAGDAPGVRRGLIELAKLADAWKVEFSLAKRAHPPFLTAVDGAFKSPTLRNVELTGPYMHHGGLGTLRQVVEFYNRGGDFDVRTNPHKHPEVVPLGLCDGDVDDLVAFLKTLTDDRVRYRRAPFDHPELRVPDGYVRRAGRWEEEWLVVPATGAAGARDPVRPFEDRVGAPKR